MKDRYDTSILYESFKEFGISCDEDMISRFITYYEMLTEWNKKINLTAITGYEDVLIKHFTDSLSAALIFRDFSGKRVIDMGTGAGFPGMPLKIAFPDIKLTLADSVNKKLDFDRALSEELGFKDVNIVHARAEDMGKDPGYRERFDVCVSRAVADLAVLSEYCLPLVKTGGVFIAYKSAESGPEIEGAGRALSMLGGNIEDDRTFHLPCSDIKRRLILIRKGKETPKGYPRKAGTPAKKPL